MFDKNGLLGKVGSLAKKAVDINQQVTENITERQIRKASEDTQGHTMYEVFSPSFGVGRKSVITESSLIVGKNEYPYEQMGMITMVNPPTSLTDGVAQATVDGKTVTISYSLGQSERFVKALNYANEQIGNAHGVEKRYKYMLNFGTATKLEVYEDYAILYHLQAGLTAIVKNSFAGGANGSVLSFSNLSVEVQDGAEGGYLFVLTAGKDVLSLPLANEDYSAAQEIVAYIRKAQEEARQAAPECINEAWEPVVGVAQEFPLGGRVLAVSEGLDAYNSYRNKFQHFAESYSKQARQEYDKKVFDLNTYLQFVPEIYWKYMDILMTKAMDILVAEGIWTASRESFQKKHLGKFHLTEEYLKNTVESMRLTSENNRNSIAKLTSHVPNVIGGGFGAKGAAKGIAKAEVFNVLRDSAEAGLLNGAQQVSQAQQAELYGRIKPDDLFRCIYGDYFAVHLSIVRELRENKKNIALPAPTEREKNIFSNMSNPNFPQDKKLEMFVSLLSTSPYREEYMRYMVEQYGDNEQTTAIREYFGYIDLM